jgi:long-chain fatty acid transport protein
MKTLQLLAWMTLSLCLMALPAWAGGLFLYELGNPGTGTASAGWAAAAQDASTVVTNPAGMTKLPQSQLLIGLQPSFPTVQFSADAGTTTSGGSGGNAGVFLPALSAFYVHKLNPKWSLGVSSVSFLGVALKFLDGWSGRYYMQETTLITSATLITAAYQINDWLSVGGGVGPAFGSIRTRTAFNNNQDPGFADGTLRYKDSAWGVVGNFGILLEPRKGTRLGVSYLSPVAFDFKAALQVDGPGPTLQATLGPAGLLDADLKLNFTFPQMVMVSAYQQITPKFALLGNVGLQNWSSFGKIGVSISGINTTSATIDANLRDTWHLAIGAQYRPRKDVILSTGFACDSSPVSDENRSITLAVDRQFRISGGILVDLRPDFSLGFAYTYWNLGPNRIDEFKGPLAGRLAGSFSTNDVHLFNVSLIWKR